MTPRFCTQCGAAVLSPNVTPTCSKVREHDIFAPGDFCGNCGEDSTENDGSEVMECRTCRGPNYYGNRSNE